MNEVLSMLSLFGPLILIVWLANLAEARRQQQEPYQGLAITSYVILGFCYMLALLAGLMISGFSLLAEQDPELLNQMGLEGAENPLSLKHI